MTHNVHTTAVRVEGLSRWYGATQALAQVDLAVERGITGLLGPNGAGKTPCCRCWPRSRSPTRARCRCSA
jgi:ABC-type multidrug transport system ATPase subunit